MQDSEHGFHFSAAAWIQCHSDVVMAAVSPELDEPPPSKKGHVKTRSLLSGDLTVSLALSGLPAPSHSPKTFLKSDEAVTQCPWRLPQLSLGNAPRIRSSPPRKSPLRWRNVPASTSSQLLLAAWQWHPASDTFSRSHRWGKRGGSTVTRSLIPTQPRDRTGTLLWHTHACFSH